ncbi:hypothetical protein SAMN02745206_01800 [Desulfacinum infernum DSM 9756]|uniref:TOTE conflict system primase domain-containing protein n=1 Tax=Desulfacinum infernum DSM 9756 TaxID=1121391 RepID=A0A1M5AVM4_9BACT|nr:CRISPR-associated primase-polymerase type A1 [Desulfacinum infernum]SHF34263.1 hypothetical protein SAMN02745206_01800 [Desulfacinum infernum DSM 9756]
MKERLTPRTDAEQAHNTPERTVDYDLLLRRLERRLLEESDPAPVLRVLSRRELWERLPPEQALRCAGLAQAAGDADLSLHILEWLTERHPTFSEAWRRRVALLETLARTEPQRNAPGDGVSRAPTVPASAPQKEGGHSAPDETLLQEPFSELRRREEAVARYLRLFQGREDCFARQWADRSKGTQGYVPVRRPMEDQDVLDHLQGRRTYGIYLLQKDSRVRLGVLDADLVSALRSTPLTPQQRDLLRREQRYLLTRLPELGREAGLPCLAEFSGGKGFHFWYFFRDPVEAHLVREALHVLAGRIQPDLSCFQLEVFPKQDRLAGKGLGNLVKLPLGVHRLTGRPSYFLPSRNRNWEAQLELLRSVRPVSREALARLKTPGESAAVVVHPKRRRWAEEYPELAVLEERCTALGHILVGCRRSGTLTVREEKILLGTLGFLPRARHLLHHVFGRLPEYNPHWVDYQLSRLRGTPLGCKKIHRLLGLDGTYCPFPQVPRYPHPLLHWPRWTEPDAAPKGERVENLQAALDNLRTALRMVERFLGREAPEPDPGPPAAGGRPEEGS